MTEQDGERLSERLTEVRTKYRNENKTKKFTQTSNRLSEGKLRTTEDVKANKSKQGSDNENSDPDFVTTPSMPKKRTHSSFHHTLLVLDTSTKTFCHYDSMRPKRPNTGKSYEDASKMVTMINTWMKVVLNQSDRILEQEVRHVVDREKSNNSELVLVEEQLATDDSNTIEWIMENYTSGFPPHTCKFNIPQQAPHS